jgi:hypothetical protein
MGVVQVRPMPAYKITALKLDTEEALTMDEIFDLHCKVYEKIFIVDNEEDLVDSVSDFTGWCILNIEYEQITSVEVTVYGLFGGEVNTTDKRFELPILGKKTDLAIVRAVKSELGWNNIRCIKQEYGDSIRLEPSGILQCADIEMVY